MSSFFRSYAQRMASKSARWNPNPLVQKRHMGGTDDPAEAAAGVGQWKKLSAVATAPVLLYAIYMFFHEEHHKERVEYPYLGLRQHKFPWAEGEREAFGVIGNAIGHHYPQYKNVEQPPPKHH